MRLALWTAVAVLAAPTPQRPVATLTREQGEIQRRLAEYVNSFARTGFFSGVVLVERHGRPLIMTTSGTAERAFNTPISADTKFQIASLSKPITDVAIGRLVDQGKLRFDTVIGTIVPGLPNGDRITIEQLMTHRSGLYSPDRDKGASSWVVLPQTTEQLVERVRHTKPISEPGTHYEYANSNYWILANVIERLSGKSYGQFMKDEIFDPLGMKNTGHRGDLLAVVPKLATGYQMDGPSRYRGADEVDWTTKTGNGSLYSTASDLAKFYQALVGRKLLSPTTTDLLLGTGKPWGYGWFHRDPKIFGRPSVWFNGRSPGFGAYLEGFIDDDTFVVILSNLYTYAPTAMSDGIGNILWGKPSQNAQPIKLYPSTPAALRAFEGRYKFGPDFHVPNGGVQVESAGDHLTMHWDAGDRVTMLLPVGPETFFDPTFWATINFEGSGSNKSIHYRSLGFSKVYEAKQVPEESKG